MTDTELVAEIKKIIRSRARGSKVEAALARYDQIAGLVLRHAVEHKPPPPPLRPGPGVEAEVA